MGSDFGKQVFFSERILAQLCWQAKPFSDSSPHSVQAAVSHALHMAQLLAQDD
jgi:hypothetical protein